MTESAPAPAPTKTKACDGCGQRVPLEQRRFDTGLCLSCQKTAEEYFGVSPEQAGIAVLAKKNHQHYRLDQKALTVRDRVRRLVLASMWSLKDATPDEKYDAEQLRVNYSNLGRSPYSKNQPQTDFLEGMK